MVLGFAFVEVENSEAYEYFFRHLRRDFPGNLTIIADGDKGCAAGMASWPEATLSRCLRHRMSNYHSAHPEHHIHRPEVKKRIFSAARTCNLEAWKIQLNSLRALGGGGEEIATWMTQIRHSIHSYCFLEAGLPRFGETTNNSSEQVNGAMKTYRTEPVISMVKGILGWIFNKFYERRCEGESWKEQQRVFTPSSESLLSDRKALAREYNVRFVELTESLVRAVCLSRSAVFEYNVTIDQGGDIPRMSCPCGKLAEYYMPCIHALAIFLKLEAGKDAKSRAWSSLDSKWYTDRVYLVKGYVQQYVAPTSHTEITSLARDELIPWEIRAKPGRKRVERFKSAPPEKRRKFECTSCGSHGHYTSTCRHPNRDKLLVLAESSKTKVEQSILRLDHD
tara:strand:- start:133 stop:1311 length:1179 start_codon:yes stop_codon:yes gene_type:complete